MSDTAGRLVYVMGPSGAGKDSILDRARVLTLPGTPVVFAHRYITRPAGSGGENHVALSAAEFELRRRQGLFAFHWQAHGNAYAIGTEIHRWRELGLTVVVSGSREHFAQAGGIDDGTVPVLITAPAERLAARLAHRGREDTGAARARLQRAQAHEVDDPRLVTIVNDGVLDDAAEQFVSLLARLQPTAPAPRVRRPAESAPVP